MHWLNQLMCVCVHAKLHRECSAALEMAYALMVALCVCLRYGICVEYHLMEILLKQ